jgi:hypothetical protein
MGSGTRSRSASAKAAIVRNSFEWRSAAICPRVLSALDGLIWLNPTPDPIALQCAYSIAVNCFTQDLADTLAFAPCESTRCRAHNADELMSAIVAKRFGRAPRAIGLRRHEAGADQRSGGARARRSEPMMLRWLRRRQDAGRLPQAGPRSPRPMSSLSLARARLTRLLIVPVSTPQMTEASAYDAPLALTNIKTSRCSAGSLASARRTSARSRRLS